MLSDGGYRHGRPWVYWSFLITVAYLVLLVLLTALALKFLNREPRLPVYLTDDKLPEVFGS